MDLMDLFLGFNINLDIHALWWTEKCEFKKFGNKLYDVRNQKQLKMNIGVKIKILKV